MCVCINTWNESLHSNFSILQDETWRKWPLIRAQQMFTELIMDHTDFVSWDAVEWSKWFLVQMAERLPRLQTTKSDCFHSTSRSAPVLQQIDISASRPQSDINPAKSHDQLHLQQADIRPRTLSVNYFRPSRAFDLFHFQPTVPSDFLLETFETGWCSHVQARWPSLWRHSSATPLDW